MTTPDSALVRELDEVKESIRLLKDRRDELEAAILLLRLTHQHKEGPP